MLNVIKVKVMKMLKQKDLVTVAGGSCSEDMKKAMFEEMKRISERGGYSLSNTQIIENKKIINRICE